MSMELVKYFIIIIGVVLLMSFFLASGKKTAQAKY